jgi:hypothetical protein
LGIASLVQSVQRVEHEHGAAVGGDAGEKALEMRRQTVGTRRDVFVQSELGRQDKAESPQ